MNDILRLKGRFNPRPGKFGGGAASLPKSKDPINGSERSVSAEHLAKHSSKIHELMESWHMKKYIEGALVDVHYRQVIAKSNRVRAIFQKEKDDTKESNNSIVGARFGDNDNHIITHHVTLAMLADAEKKFRIASLVLREEFGGAISATQLDGIKQKNIDFKKYDMPESTFRQVVVDGYYAALFEYPEMAKKPSESIITLYRTSEDMKAVLKEIGISLSDDRIFGDATVQLYPPEIDTLYREAPYLIAMAVEDMNTLVQDDQGNLVERETWMTFIEEPGDEPVIGVIDTPFDTSSDVYFRKWVQYEHMIDPEIDITTEDKRHGTAVSSIIVDGPSINPSLEDGCGKFRVKHFGVARKGQMSSFKIMRDIESIVKANPSIRVWNLSLGSVREVAKSYISPEAAMLDRLQNDYDVIFVVSGTNYNEGSKPGEKLIGSPADSINSIVVNALDHQGQAATYSRRGHVLSFFKKPDVSYFGGDHGLAMKVCTPLGEEHMTGTSLATPWVTRKVAFMIEVLGLSREVAKALLIDSAAGWDDIGSDIKKASLLGFGAVPKHINDVVRSKDEEIKFFIDSETEAYDTYNYNLPVPTDNGKHPFIAKATLCYFPKCSINEGVDYTSTELDVYIGRMKRSGKNTGLKSINKNVQSIEDGEWHAVDEETARKVFRKWDNTKHIREVINDKLVPRKAYEDGLWGISIKTKNRTNNKDGINLKFGLVITLKEMNGVNRINDFVQQCSLRGWLVNEVNVNNSVEVYEKLQETIEL